VFQPTVPTVPPPTNKKTTELMAIVTRLKLNKKKRQKI